MSDYRGGQVVSVALLVVERRPAALKAGVQTRGGEPKNFQYCLSSAETQQPVDRMRCKTRGRVSTSSGSEIEDFFKTSLSQI